MFGYIKIYKDEMKVREFNLFKSYYCGLCKTLKKEYGFASRMGLSYDITFLAVLLSAVMEEKPAISPENCIANPFKKKPIVNTRYYLEYTAAINVILTYLKVKDDIKDNHSVKALLFLPFLLRAKYKAKRRFPEKFREIEARIRNLNGAEKRKCPDVDVLAHEFGEIMKTIFSAPFLDDENTLRILSHIGYSLGRFIYILDAYEDMERDKKEKNFNPFLLQKTPPDPENIKLSLTYTLSDVSNSYELLNLTLNKPILNNIIYLGLLDVLDKTISKGEHKHDRSL